MSISLFKIFRIFFIIGLQLLGGGYVIIPLLKKYLVDENQMTTEEELVDYFALCQCIPGIIAINISVLIGYKMRKTLGAIMAILGIIIPAFVCILVVAKLLINIVDSQYVQYAFWGIRISVIVLVIMTIKEMWEKSVNSYFSYVLFFIICILMVLLPVSPAVVILLSAAAGVIYSKVRARNNA